MKYSLESNVQITLVIKPLAIFVVFYTYKTHVSNQLIG